ncbi:MAG: ATP synthase F1 subunit gamma [Candidatus Cryptobacteroides sp.]
MASLKEIKGRIASVRATLKITSAMKMVASAKLRKAQQAIGNMLPYEKQLHRMLVDVISAAGARGARKPEYSLTTSRPVRKVALVAFSSNSSLCGAFNSNIVREALDVVGEYLAAGLSASDITVFSVGKKMAEAMKRAGFESPADYSAMAAKPSYEAASSLAEELLKGFLEEKFDKVELIHTHFRSTSSQIVSRQTYLPMSIPQDEGPVTAPEDLIVEPSVTELMETLLPRVVRMRIYSTLLDNNAAEQAARTVAMQTATDNGNVLLTELTLDYNKGRQQKITSEILDIVGATLQ